MFTLLLQTKSPLLSVADARSYDPPPAVAIAPPASTPRAEEPDLTCLSLVRRKKGKTVSMKLLLRHHAGE